MRNNQIITLNPGAGYDDMVGIEIFCRDCGTVCLADVQNLAWIEHGHLVIVSVDCPKCHSSYTLNIMFGSKDKLLKQEIQE
jgi:hypothetical protein